MLFLAFGIPGIGELWPILIVVLVLFGAKKLPELARAMGSSVNQFKKGLSEEGSKPDELTEGRSKDKDEDSDKPEGSDS